MLIIIRFLWSTRSDRVYRLLCPCEHWSDYLIFVFFCRKRTFYARPDALPAWNEIIHCYFLDLLFSQLGVLKRYLSDATMMTRSKSGCGWCWALRSVPPLSLYGASVANRPEMSVGQSWNELAAWLAYLLTYWLAGCRPMLYGWNWSTAWYETSRDRVHVVTDVGQQTDYNNWIRTRNGEHFRRSRIER